ncbi:hypothetical protein BGW39_006831 [Mortierella sp. 14UC]|nr:hypothetical protein BGW39_006831 [Mortierella sp. 14UC]
MNPGNYNNGQPLGNGCFDHPAPVQSSPDHAPPTPLSSSSVRTKSRMETTYLVDLPAPPATTTTEPPHHNAQEQPPVVVKDRSPGWKLRQIKETPTQHVAHSIWAMFPSLSTNTNTNSNNTNSTKNAGNNNNAPWWFPSSGGASSFSPSSSSPNNLIPCDTDPSTSSSLYADLDDFFDADANAQCEIGSEHHLLSSTMNLNLDLEANSSTTTTTTTTTTNATTGTIKPRSESYYSDPHFQNTFFATHWPFQQLRASQHELVPEQEQKQEQENVQEQEQKKEKEEEEGVDTPVLSPTAASMELTDSQGTSSPSLWSFSSGVKFNTMRTTTATIIQDEASKSRARRNPYTTLTTTTDTLIGLGLGLLYPTYASLNRSTAAEAATEAMNRIRRRVAEAEIKAQYAYLARNNWLSQMLLQDKEGKEAEEEVNGSGGISSDEDGNTSAEADMETEMETETETESDESFSSAESSSSSICPDSPRGLDCLDDDQLQKHKASVLECPC